jgi:hypothetical protein
LTARPSISRNDTLLPKTQSKRQLDRNISEADNAQRLTQRIRVPPNSQLTINYYVE